MVVKRNLSEYWIDFVKFSRSGEFSVDIRFF